MSVSCRAHGCIFLSFLLKRQKITTVGSELPENITFQGKRQKKSAMGRSVPKRWAQVDFTGGRSDDAISCVARPSVTRGIAEPRKLPPLRVSTLQSPSSSNAQSSKPPVCALTRDHRDTIDRSDEIAIPPSVLAACMGTPRGESSPDDADDRGLS